MVRNTLNDALLYNRWLDMGNYWKNTRPMYNQCLPLLLRYAFPQRLEKYAKQRVSLYSSPDEILIQATECYTALQSKLKTLFFFGNE
jgi:hypothetical protein